MTNEKVIVAGFGGQGVMLLGQILAYAANEEGLHTIWIPSYGPETRGGTANCSVVISENPIHSPIVSECDTLIAFNEPSLKKFEHTVKQGGTIIANSGLISDYPYRKDVSSYPIDVSKTALDLGNLKVINIVALGAYLKLSGRFDKQKIETVFEKLFTGDKAKLIDVNKQALDAGMQAV